jgi:hypothetical protein
MNVYIGESIGRRTSAETHVHLLRNHQTTQWRLSRPESSQKKVF